ncbi:MAG TPA: 30S ribosomal protein S17 [Alphaproteobacteria bacterium]|jgi:small subunit ribosomal protein S17|nr:30S ribosomal protein S17 [Alphaproteobacteria bacterium]HIK86882.1 30S ribosomal protein S17 [Alphaproteobacteria bacterium]|tara:strand:- start:881 stop:1123 length:243 start_codon:yes stop_codon:yes gene_type:complete
MPKRILQGTVVSAASEKTIVVNVDRRVRHPLYKKTITRSSKFHAHDENNNYKIGDKVRIIECRPISKKKTWTVLTESITS